MIFYQLDYVVDEVRKASPSPAQVRLKKYAGAEFAKREAEFLCERIDDHKWYISERIGRDVGFRVAAVDYLENLYRPTASRNRKPRGLWQKLTRPFGAGLKNYLVSKSTMAPH